MTAFHVSQKKGFSRIAQVTHEDLSQPLLLLSLIDELFLTSGTQNYEEKKILFPRGYFPNAAYGGR